jgi:hypothetical protein
MAPHTYAKRIERLQEALAAQLNKPVASRFLPLDPDLRVEDYARLQEEELDRMVAAGVIGVSAFPKQPAPRLGAKR